MQSIREQGIRSKGYILGSHEPPTFFKSEPLLTMNIK